MPILDVEIVGDDSGLLATPGLARRIADTAGKILGAAPGGTWVKLHYLPSAHYAESSAETSARPVFVKLLQFEYRAKDATAQALSVAIAAITGRPAENVHILFEPEARGRIAFGGKLRE